MDSSAVSSVQNTQRKSIRKKFLFEEIESETRTIDMNINTNSTSMSLKGGSGSHRVLKTKRTYTRRKNVENKKSGAGKSESIVLASKNQITRKYTGTWGSNDLENEHSQLSENHFSADLRHNRFDADKENQRRCPEEGTEPSGKAIERSGDDDFDIENTSRIVHEIRSGYQERISAKKRKLDDCFKDIKNLPRKIEKETREISLERTTEIGTVKSNISTVIERLEKVQELQTINRKKLDIMVESFQKSHTQANDAAKQVITGLQQILEHYSLNMEKLEEKQENISRNHIEQCKSQLYNLHKKIFEESQDEEKRRLWSLGGYIG